MGEGTTVIDIDRPQVAQSISADVYNNCCGVCHTWTQINTLIFISLPSDNKNFK